MQSTLAGINKRLWMAPLLVLVCSTSMGAARADLVPPRGVAPRNAAPRNVAADIPLLIVRPLGDGGGLVDTGAEEEGREALNVRMARSLQKYLEEGARGRFTVAWNEAKPATTQTVWTLEGELSHVATGAAGDESGPYLGAIRLFRQTHRIADRAPTRRLVGTWLGRSESLRFLSVNLRHDPRVDSQGLAGEWGKRIIETIVSFGNEEFLPSFARWLGGLPGAANVEVRVERADEKPAGDDSAESRNTVLAGSNFRVRVTPRERSETYLFEIDGEGHPRMLPYRREASTVRAFGVESTTGPITIPAAPLPATAVGERRFVVLMRRIHSRSSNTLAVQADAQAGSTSGVGRASQALRNAPVEVLGDVARREDDSGALRRIFETAGDDAAGTWSIQNLVVRVVERRD